MSLLSNRLPSNLIPFVVILALWSAPWSIARGQESGATPVTSSFTDQVSVRVINVDVIVTDRSGRSIPGLTQGDFTLRVDGETMEISNFYSQSAEESTGRLTTVPGSGNEGSEFRTLENIEASAPKRSHVVLLIDHTRLRSSNRKRAFKAIREAVDNLDQNALVSVVGNEGSLVFYSDFLFDRGAIHRILDNVSKISGKSATNEIDRRQVYDELARGMSGGLLARSTLADESMLMARIQAYAALEYQRGVNSLRQIERVIATLGGVPGRKTLFYLGEGVPTRPGEGMFVEWRNRFADDGPETLGIRRYDFDTNYNREVGNYDLTVQMQQLASAANRAGVTLFSIDADGDHGSDIRSALSEQGATSETVSVVDENYREPLEYASKATGGRLLVSSGKLADQMVELVEGMSTFYSLGFTVPDSWELGSDHRIEVDVARKGLVVNHRTEVRLPARDEREASGTVAALLYQIVDNPLRIAASPGFAAPRDDGTAALPINIEIPIDRISFIPRNGQHAGSVTIYVSVKDAAGNPGKVQKVPFHLNIPDDKFELAKKDAAHYPLPLVIRAGDQQVGVAVRDDLSGAFSAVRLDIAQHSQF